MSTLIAGIGLIDKNNDPARDQLVADLAACQVAEPLLSTKKREMEGTVARLHGTETNFFQRPSLGLGAPRDVRVERAGEEGPVKVLWNCAYAAGDPIVRYEVYRRAEKIASIPFRPQINEEPFSFLDENAPRRHYGGLYYKVRAVDSTGDQADSTSVKPV